MTPEIAGLPAHDRPDLDNDLSNHRFRATGWLDLSDRSIELVPHRSDRLESEHELAADQEMGLTGSEMRDFFCYDHLGSPGIDRATRRSCCLAQSTRDRPAVPGHPESDVDHAQR